MNPSASSPTPSSATPGTPGARLTDDIWGGLAAMLVALPSAIAFGVATLAGLGGEYAAQGALAGMLGATALGLASFWSSPPSRRGRRTLALCGFPSDTELIGVIYLGWPSDTVETPERPPLRTNSVR